MIFNNYEFFKTDKLNLCHSPALDIHDIHELKLKPAVHELLNISPQMEVECTAAYTVSYLLISFSTDQLT